MNDLLKKTISLTSVLCLAAASAASMPVMTASADTTVYGDVDNSGSVDIGDVIVIQRYLAGIIPSSSINMKYADVDQNAVIDVNDSKTILARLVNKVPKLPYSESTATFNLPQSKYTVPADEARTYVKYNCATRTTSTYSLAKASAVSTTAGGTDDRVIDSSDNAQCIVRLSYPGGGCGSGFIIDDHTIVTAGHCLYSGISFLSPKIQIYNAEGTEMIKELSPSELHIPQKWYSTGSEYYDYGLIYVEDNLSAYGKMSLGIVTDAYANTSQTLHVSGFPDTVNNVSGNTLRYRGTGNVTGETDEYLLHYTAYASGGDSGGPVYIEYTLNGETFRSAIAIHGYGDRITHTPHYGPRITLPLLRFYYSNSNIG